MPSLRPEVPIWQERIYAFMTQNAVDIETTSPDRLIALRPSFARGAARAASNCRGVTYVPKPWQPLNVLLVAEQALAYGKDHQR